MRFHDFFAGIGGSSTGLRAAGLEGVVALNHWHYAIELHNANHPDMAHDEADVWKADPRRYRPAEVGWFSPECRRHSQASGIKRSNEHYLTDLWRNPTTDPADDRSRLLMESVPYLAEMAGYRYVLVENVVEVVKWIHFDRWLKEMSVLDYRWKLLFLNSQFFGTPQSRDRFFAVFWKRGEAAPNLDFRPPSLCAKCGWVDGVQAWKPGRWYGKYGQQKRSCTEKYKIRAVRQELRRRGAKTALVALSLTYDELERIKPSEVKWVENWWPLVDLRMTRFDVQQQLEARNFPYLMSTECDFCPFQNWERWSRLSPARLQEVAALESRWGKDFFLTDRRKPLADALAEMRFLDSQPRLFCGTAGYCGDTMPAKPEGAPKQ